MSAWAFQLRYNWIVCLEAILVVEVPSFPKMSLYGIFSIHYAKPLFRKFVSTSSFSLFSSPFLVFSVALSFPPSSLSLSKSCWGAEWSEPRWSHHVFISLYSPFTFFSHRKPIRVGLLGIDWLSMETHTHTHPLTLLCACSHSSSRPHPFHCDFLTVSMTWPN